MSYNQSIGIIFIVSFLSRYFLHPFHERGMGFLMHVFSVISERCFFAYKSTIEPIRQSRATPKKRGVRLTDTFQCARVNAT